MRVRAKIIEKYDVPELALLPKHLREDLWAEAYSNILTVHPLFMLYSRTAVGGTWMVCNVAIDNMYLLSFEILLHQYDVVTEWCS